MDPTRSFATSRAAISSSSPASASAAVALVGAARRPAVRAPRPTDRCGCHAVAPHFAPKAKHIIYLFMAGAPTQLDLFDNKPALQQVRRPGDPEGASSRKASGSRSSRARRACSARPSRSRSTAIRAPRSRSCSRTWRSIADEIAVVRSMQTTQFNHAPAQIFMNTGQPDFGRPSMGSWLTYGLGSESRDLPGFVVLLSGENAPDGGKSLLGQRISPDGLPGRRVPFEGGPGAVRLEPRRRRRAARGAMLDRSRDRPEPSASTPRVGDPEIDTRIASYEMAYRMQSSVPELTDISSEPATIHEMYGTRAGQGVVRQQLPARAPAGRARRAVRAALPPRMGHPRRQRRHRHRDEACRELCLETDRAIDRARLTDLETARPARHDARRLGRRVRPHADERGAQRLEAAGARPSSARVHDVDGGRRHQARHHGRTDRRFRLQHRRRSRWTSTICTRRSCTCSGSTTRS